MPIRAAISGSNMQHDEAFLSLLSSQRELLNQLNMESAVRKAESVAFGNASQQQQSNNMQFSSYSRDGHLGGTSTLNYDNNMILEYGNQQMGQPLSLPSNHHPGANLNYITNRAILAERRSSIDMLLSKRLSLGLGYDSYLLPEEGAGMGYGTTSRRGSDASSPPRKSNKRDDSYLDNDSQHLLQEEGAARRKKRRLSSLGFISASSFFEDDDVAAAMQNGNPLSRRDSLLGGNVYGGASESAAMRRDSLAMAAAAVLRRDSLLAGGGGVGTGGGAPMSRRDSMAAAFLMRRDSMLGGGGSFLANAFRRDSMFGGSSLSGNMMMRRDSLLASAILSRRNSMSAAFSMPLNDDRGSGTDNVANIDEGVVVKTEQQTEDEKRKLSLDEDGHGLDVRDDDQDVAEENVPALKTARNLKLKKKKSREVSVKKVKRVSGDDVHETEDGTVGDKVPSLGMERASPCTSDPPATRPRTTSTHTGNRPSHGKTSSSVVCDVDHARFKAVMEAFNLAMERSQKSQQDIHDWDRKMGLKRSHSKTMRLSSRSRKKLRSILKKEIHALTPKP